MKCIQPGMPRGVTLHDFKHDASSVELCSPRRVDDDACTLYIGPATCKRRSKNSHVAPLFAPSLLARVMNVSNPEEI